jgi:prepilin-type processing-associated H-X9-DG protein
MRFSLRLVFELTAICGAWLAFAFWWGEKAFPFVWVFTFAVIIVRAVAGKKRKTAIVLGVLAPVGVLVYVFFPRLSVVGYHRHGPPTSNCAHNMDQIARALYRYHAEHGHFPPAYTVDAQGNRLHSWRTLLLPYLADGEFLHTRIRLDEPWNSKHNSQFHNGFFWAYKCPSCRNRPYGKTPYLAVVGPNTAWRGSETISMTEITDAPEETILLVEARDADVHWMEPRDLEVDENGLQIGQLGMIKLSSPHYRERKQGIFNYPVYGAHVLFVDGHVAFSTDNKSEHDIRAMLTVSAGD